MAASAPRSAAWPRTPWPPFLTSLSQLASKLAFFSRALLLRGRASANHGFAAAIAEETFMAQDSTSWSMARAASPANWSPIIWRAAPRATRRGAGRSPRAISKNSPKCARLPARRTTRRCCAQNLTTPHRSPSSRAARASCSPWPLSALRFRAGRRLRGGRNRLCRSLRRDRVDARHDRRPRRQGESQRRPHRALLRLQLHSVRPRRRLVCKPKPASVSARPASASKVACAR